MNNRLPRHKENDYTNEMAEARRQFIENQCNFNFQYLQNYNFDPQTLSGNIENFAGVAQVPIGFAGPLLIHGEEAKGEFFIPMATTEGTLVASYNRGMKLCGQAGGITTTVLDDAMQRAPIFIFENARYSKIFGEWVQANFENIKAEAEKTTSSGKLRDIEQYTVGKMRWLRFNFTTGDAAGQNMVTKAVHKSCQWILKQGVEGLEHFSMAANFDTDKKHSQLNNLHSRGKRVVAEITLPSELVKDFLRTTPQNMFYQRQLSNMGALLSGSVNNGTHFANGITALFIATGQDVANIAESSAGFNYVELKENGDYYFSVTIPSLIVATYGGGTGLATQRECLEMMDCYGSGKVKKLAEIIAAVVLCGELSLGGAILADEWVSSHEQFGRNRP